MTDDPFADTDLFGESISKQSSSALRRRFKYPPFSVINTRDGGWQKRKRQWLKLGIQSELGRGQNALKHGDYSGNIDFYAQKRQLEVEIGETLTTDEALRQLIALGRAGPVAGNKSERIARTAAKQLLKGEDGGTLTKYRGATKMRARPPHGPNVTQGADGKLVYKETNAPDGQQSGTSVFDPVLTELMYSWFCPPEGMVVDPFAGGSVRGIVAATLGRSYWGAELREEQVLANIEQGEQLVPDADVNWVEGDSYVTLPTSPRADLIFTCPPYGDLEQYSDDPRDISSMSYGKFRRRYRQIIERAGARLRNNRFAVIVVGDFRDRKTGMLRGFVGDTVVAFEDAGMEFYNDIVLVTSVGSLPIRVGKQFSVARKVGRTHQQVLVFVKGDPRKATAKCQSL